MKLIRYPHSRRGYAWGPCANATDETLFMPGWTAFNTINTSEEVVHWHNWGGGNLDTPIRPSDEIHVFANPYSLSLRPNANPVTDGTGLIIDPVDLIETFQYWSAGLDRTGCFNEAGQLLMSFTYRTESTMSTAGLVLLELEVTDPSPATVELLGSQFITVPTELTSVFVHKLAPLADGFLIAASNGIWHLNEAGEIALVSDQSAHNLFVVGDDWYGIRWDGEVIRSQDAGASWELRGSISPTYVEQTSIDGRTVVYLADNIYEIDLESWELTELEAEALDGNQITSIVEFQDEVWVTTLSGLFHRPMEDFFTPAPEQDKAGGLKLRP